MKKSDFNRIFSYFLFLITSQKITFRFFRKSNEKIIKFLQVAGKAMKWTGDEQRSVSGKRLPCGKYAPGMSLSKGLHC